MYIFINGLYIGGKLSEDFIFINDNWISDSKGDLYCLNDFIQIYVSKNAGKIPMGVM